jgi:hypothetical protein
MNKYLRFDDEAFRPTFYKSVRSTKRSQATLLIQMRLKHTQLNAHLHRMNLPDSPDCDFCTGIEENLIHFIIYCKKYERERETLRRRVGNHNIEIRYLLKDGREELMKYIAATKRLEKYFPKLLGRTES